MLLLLGIDLDNPTTVFVIAALVMIVALVVVGWMVFKSKIASKTSARSSSAPARERLVVPGPDVLANDPAQREALRSRISSMGFTHRAGHAPASDPTHAGQLYSECYAIVNGVSVPVRRRYRNEGIIHDGEGEQQARRLADTLGFNLTIL